MPAVGLICNSHFFTTRGVLENACCSFDLQLAFWRKSVFLQRKFLPAVYKSVLYVWVFQIDLNQLFYLFQVLISRRKYDFVVKYTHKIYKLL